MSPAVSLRRASELDRMKGEARQVVVFRSRTVYKRPPRLLTLTRTNEGNLLLD